MKNGTSIARIFEHTSACTGSGWIAGGLVRSGEPHLLIRSGYYASMIQFKNLHRLDYEL